MGPYISTSLFKEDRATPFRLALVDSGADASVFPCKSAHQLGIDPKDGDETPLHDFTGDRKRRRIGWIHTDVGFALKFRDQHEPVIAIVGKVVFTEDMELSGVLGRSSFFESFQVGFNEEGQEVNLVVSTNTRTLNPADVPSYLRIHAVEQG